MLPNLVRQNVAQRAGVFARGGDTGVNRIRVLPFKGDEINDCVARNLGIELIEKLGVFQAENDGFPMLMVGERVDVQHQLEIDIQHACVVFRALRVAA